MRLYHALFISLLVSSGTQTTQNTSMEIPATSAITLSGNPQTLSVTLDTKGSGQASDSSTTYTVLCNTNARGTLKIIGFLSSGGDMPNHTQLQVALASNKGNSKGAKKLSTTQVDLVTKLPTVLADTASITYTFTVSKASSLASSSFARTVTFTLISS